MTNEATPAPDFGHIARRKVSGDATMEYEFFEIVNRDGTSPVLLCRPGTRENVPYFDHLLKRNRRYSRQIRAGKIDAKLAQVLIESDKMLYPMHVVYGWRNVFSSDGTPCAFSPGACVAFFEAMPDDYFEVMRGQVGDIANFRDEADMPTDPEDLEASGGN